MCNPPTHKYTSFNTETERWKVKLCAGGELGVKPANLEVRHLSCNVLLCVAVCCRVLPCVAVCCSVLQCVAVCCSVVQWCSVVQCDVCVCV